MVITVTAETRNLLPPPPPPDPHGIHAYAPLQRDRRQQGIERRGRRVDVQTVEGLAGTLERVDDVETGDRLPLGVLSVGDRVPDDVCR